MITLLVGLRPDYDCRDFIDDLASRLKKRIQLPTDGFGAYRGSRYHRFWLERGLWYGHKGVRHGPRKAGEVAFSGNLHVVYDRFDYG